MREPAEHENENKTRPHYVQWGLTALCVVAASLVVCFALFQMPKLSGAIKKVVGILEPFIYGFVMAYLLLPIFNGLYRTLRPRMKGQSEKIVKGTCSILSLLAGIAIVGVLLWLVLPEFVSSIFSLMGSMDGYLQEISDWGEVLLKDNPMLERNFLSLYEQFSDQVVNWVQNIALPQLVELMTGVISTVSVLFNLLIGMIIALYALNSKDTFAAQGKKAIYSLLSVPHANSFLARLQYAHRMFGRFISGKLLDSFIIGVITFFALSILDIPYAVLIAVIIGVTNIVPFFGPFIGAIPSTILILVIDWVQALIFIVFILLLQIFDGYILGPKILGNSTGLSSFWVMFAIIVFSGLFGFVGMVIGVPLFAVLYSMVQGWFNRRLKKRKLPTSTGAYRGETRLDPDTLTFVPAALYGLPLTEEERAQAELLREQAKK